MLFFVVILSLFLFMSTPVHAATIQTGETDVYLYVPTKIEVTEETKIIDNIPTVTYQIDSNNHSVVYTWELSDDGESWEPATTGNTITIPLTKKVQRAKVTAKNTDTGDEKVVEIVLPNKDAETQVRELPSTFILDSADDAPVVLDYGPDANHETSDAKKFIIYAGVGLWIVIILILTAYYIKKRIGTKRNVHADQEEEEMENA